jgi:acetamidase/formamidase
MDCKELVEGSTIYFPIEAAGALLSLGDGHAAQGHGEVGGMAIECMIDEVELSVELIDVAPTGIVGHVSADTPQGAVAFGFAEALDKAMADAR